MKLNELLTKKIDTSQFLTKTTMIQSSNLSYFDSTDLLLAEIKNNLAAGVYISRIQISGTFYACIIDKTSSQYASVLRFGYNGNVISMNRLVAGTWTGFNNI